MSDTSDTPPANCRSANGIRANSVANSVVAHPCSNRDAGNKSFTAFHRSRRQRRHRKVGCPIPIGSRLFPFGRIKRERYNLLNLNGSEGECPAAPTVPAVFRVALYGPRLSRDRCHSCSSRAAAVPPGDSSCPCLPGFARSSARFPAIFLSAGGFQVPLLAFCNVLNKQ